jgi:hypothetical protein
MRGVTMTLPKMQSQIAQARAFSTTEAAAASAITETADSHGAVGDGTTDDTAAIQAAINTVAMAGGGSVVLSASVYKITSALVIDDSHVRLVGAGTTTELKQFTAGADHIQIGAAATQINGVTIESLSLTAGTTKSAGAAIAVQNAVYTRLLDLNVNGAFRAINLFDKTFGTFIEGAQLTNSVESALRYTTTGISGASNGVFLNNCVFDNPTGSEPTVAGINWINGEGFYAVNVEILRQKVGMLMAPQSGQGCSFGFFTNVLFDLCSSYGVEAAPVAGGAVFSNSFVNCWSSTNGIYGFYLHPATGTFDHMEFTSCRALNNAQHGWYIGQYCDHVKILGGEAIANSRTTTNTTDGVYVENSTDSLSIIGLVSKGAIMGYTNNQRYGINFSGAAIDNCIVEGCDLRNNGTGAFNGLPTTGESRVFGNLGVSQWFLGSEAVLMSELASAPAAVTNGVRLWAEDSGGKTRLMARFPTGANVQIAIEP